MLLLSIFFLLEIIYKIFTLSTNINMYKSSFSYKVKLLSTTQTNKKICMLCSKLKNESNKSQDSSYG